MNKTETRQTRRVLRVLKKANELLTPETWIKGHLLRRTSKQAPYYCDLPADCSDAECWCLLGAMDVATYRLKLSGTHAARDGKLELAQTVSRGTKIPGTSVASFNDRSGTTLKDVRRTLRVTIDRLQRRLEVAA